MTALLNSETLMMRLTVRENVRAHLEKLKAEKEKTEKAQKAKSGAGAGMHPQEKDIPDAIRDAMPQVPDTLPFGVTLPDPAKTTHSDALKNAIEEAHRP